MKLIIILFVVISQIIFVSCSNELTSPLQDVEISDHILENYFVTSVSFDSKGTAWIGTFKQGLIKYDGTITKYDVNNSTLPDSIHIRKIEVDNNDNVWIGSDKGLIKYDNQIFEVYNKLNAPLITNNVHSLTVDTENNIWFTSCMFRVGGIIKYDGITWKIFTPQNSKLPGSLVSDIITDNQNNKWLAINEGDIGCSIVKIKDNNITVYSEDDMGIKPFYFANLTSGSNNHIYGAIDYSLSSLANNSRPNIISFNGSKWKTITPSDKNGNSLGYVGVIAFDRIGNLWASTSDNGLVVYNGKEWIYNKEELMINESIYDINFDQKNRTWISTTNGIYIAN